MEPSELPLSLTLPRKGGGDRTFAAALAVVLAGLAAWAIAFSYLAVPRHAAGGSHAQDMGFTDQVLWSLLQGQGFRMSLYLGAAEWNTELAVAAVAQPESLLAFHFEPLLALLVPLYAV